MANHSGPESCGSAREGATEALTGETGRSGIEPRNQESGTPTLLSEAEGNTEQGVNRKPCDGPARSKTLHMPGSLLHGSRGNMRPAGQERLNAVILRRKRWRSRIRP
jgi:RNA-directed DNA polymerase